MFTDFKDSSTNDFAITASGDAQLVNTVKKYGNAAGYFDGDGDYIQTEIADWNVGVDGEPFTIEFWAYKDGSWPGLEVFCSKHGGVEAWNGTNGLNFNFYFNAPTTLYFEYYANGTTQTNSSNIALPENQWIHFAIVYDGTTTTVYVDGVAYGTNSHSYDLVASASTFEVGSQVNGNYPFNGYIDDLRITKGIARYTANFTPPTQQLPDPSDPHGANVSLLLHMDGTNGSQSFVDSSNNNFTITANGDAQISDAEKKFGNGAGYFDGDADFLELPDSPAFDFGSDDFTIECWFYSTLSGFQALIARWNDGNAFFLGVNTDTPNVQLYVNGTSAILGAAPVINQWYHIAAVRSGTGIKLFLNGVQVGSTYNIGYTAIDSSDALLRIGADAGGNPKFEGYIDEVRITKGFARYTANFTPQTAPFANPTV